MTENNNVYRKVSIAALIMMMSVMLSRVAGFVREIIIAWIGGAGPMVDAYQVAFIIPDILNHILASGFMSVTFIPIFSRYLAADNEKDGWKAFSNILFCFGLLLLVLVIICMIFAPQLVRLVAPGLQEEIMYDYAAYMTRIMMPAQLCFFAGGMLMAVQYAKERFFIPALAPFVYNLGIIAGGLILGPYMGVMGLAWGVLLGAVVGNMLIQVIGAAKAGMRIYPRFKPLDRDLVKYTLLTIPLMVGVSITFSTEFVIRFFGSFLGYGRIAALNYALRIMLLFIGFFGQAVGTASYPFMAKMAANNDMKGLNDLLDRTIRYMSLLIPLSLLVFVVRFEIVQVLFERGNFTTSDTLLTGKLLGGFMLGAFAFSLYMVVVRGYYAVQNTWFPALFGLLAFLVSLPFYIWAAVYVRNSLLLVLVISIASIVQMVLLYVIWSHKTKNANAVKVGLFYVKMIAVSLAAFGILYGFKMLVFGAFDPMIDSYSPHGVTRFWHSLLVFAVCSAFYGILGFIAGYVFKIEEILFFFRKLLRRKTAS